MPPTTKAQGRPVADPPVSTPAATTSVGSRAADVGLLAGFLGLAYLFGVFPLKDTDFWWHLRTGDLIRETGRVPTTDIYTFGAEGRPWIDLHWGFEVLISLGYQYGRVPFLNLAKCAVTCLALAILLLAKRRGWPLWATILGWLPALFVLSGRMYVRPETLSFLWLASYLAILFRWKERPGLAYLLPAVQVAWVNTQGLFVLGPIVLAFALIDAAMSPEMWTASRRSWWKKTLGATGLVGVACVLNPYGLEGTLFPIALARTMSSPIFETTIGELMPVPLFIEKMGIDNLPLQLHILTMVVGGLSFLVPLTWRVMARMQDGPAHKPAGAKAGKTKGKKVQAEAPPSVESWTLSPFRLMLFAAFTVLGMKATRNTHQFATVIGAVTAWNVAEWAAALRARGISRGRTFGPRAAAMPRLVTFGALVSAAVLVGSGNFYAMTGEGRTIGIGEEPLWFPHDAAKFCGREGMPDRFLVFHNGHAGIFEYYNGPKRKVFADARLEVIGPELYQQYLTIQEKIARDAPGWADSVAAMGNPGVFVDNVHAQTAGLTAALYASPRYRLAWFDPVASVFVPESSLAARNPVDFAGLHFHPDPARTPTTPEAYTALVKALANLILNLGERKHESASRPAVLLGAGLARRWRDLQPKSAQPWKYIGLIEAFRDPLGTPERPVVRYSSPFDPVFDLSLARSAYALREALDRDADDPQTLLMIAAHDQSSGLNEAAVHVLRHLATLDPKNQEIVTKERTRRYVAEEVDKLLKILGPEPSTEWKNMAELDAAVRSLLSTGRVSQAADLLESAYPVASRPWEVTDRLATLRLHLGRPDLARDIWAAAVNPPRPELVAARTAAAEFVMDDVDSAREHYKKAIAIAPDLFEAHLGLAMLERDAGRAADAVASATRALALAPGDVARASARQILDIASPSAGR